MSYSRIQAPDRVSRTPNGLEGVLPHRSHRLSSSTAKAVLQEPREGLLVVGGGFEPPKSLTTDLQSAPFGRSGTPPHNSYVLLPGTEGKSLVLCRAAVWQNGAGDGNRTYNLLITNQLLCRLSYASTRVDVFTQKLRAWQAKFCNFQNFFCIRVTFGPCWPPCADCVRLIHAQYSIGQALRDPFL